MPLCIKAKIDKWVVLIDYKAYNEIQNLVPFSGTDEKVMVPLCRRTICLEMARPIPFPPGFVVKNGIKI
jgi:hypothetical protein